MELHQWQHACELIVKAAQDHGVKAKTITDLRCSVHTAPGVFTGNLSLAGHGSRLVLQIVNMENRGNGLALDGFAIVDLGAVVCIEPEFQTEEG